MDFGAVGLDGLVGSDAGFAPIASDPETKQKWYGSGFLKQERSGTTEEDLLRSSKLAKTDHDFSASKAMLLNQKNTLLRSKTSLFSDAHHQQQQMLSFSAPKSEALLVDKNTQNSTFPYSYHTLSAHGKNTGYSSGATMHGVLTGARGPFTPSQWMELEHQALIYKYITANVAVPSNLLIPIKKALDSAGFYSFSGGLPRPSSLGWGSFHLGFSNSTDPEPGRCRRTDGKKWRCSRDAVADQKYCERHMNRGRHRSRKPVEGQSGQSFSGTTTAANAVTTTSKVMSCIPADNNAPSSISVVVPGGGSASNTVSCETQQLKIPQPDSSITSAAGNINRIFVSSKESEGENPALSMLSSTIELKAKENPMLAFNRRNSYEESPRSEFCFVTSDSLLNPSQKGGASTMNRSFDSSQNLTDQETDSQQCLRHFFEDWPKNMPERSGVSWPELGMQSERTQLSISIPMASTDFMSATSSPANEKVTLSPLRLSQELHPIQMGLGIGSSADELNRRQANWIPISWESSLGGPLGEVLHHSNNNNNNKNNGSECVKNNSSAALNLMSDGGDNSPPIGSSPTGVLQKTTTFRSLSNSSAGSSPRAAENNNNNKTQDGASVCNDLLGTSSSLPAL